MRPGDYKILKKEVFPTKQVILFLGLEFMLNTYHEINFSDSKEKVNTPNISKLKLDVWYSWN